MTESWPPESNPPTARSGEGARSVAVVGIREGAQFAAQDWVAEEVPVALEFNGISHAVMLATPADLHDFALGFSLTEGILDGPHELYGAEEEAAELGITLRLEVSSAAFARLKQRRRSMTGRTGCGLCGTESLDHVVRELPTLPTRALFGSEAIAAGMAAIGSRQALQQVTGATHAAAWCTAEGQLQCLREDVGRHNALDKLIGALARSDIDPSTGFIVVTSRASFEMVQKTVMAGVPLLAAVSASTSLAVSTAETAGLTLVGFARHRNLVIYSHARRVNLCTVEPVRAVAKISP